jgi:hypothetical protein
VEVAEPAVANYQVAGGPLDENVFGLGSTGDLYLDSFNGAKWNWTDLGTPGPAVTSFGSGPVVVSYQATGQSLSEQVFLTGNGGQLYYWALYDNGAQSKWMGLGYGAGGEMLDQPAAIDYQVAGGTLHENVFVTGQDGNLYLDFWDGTGWNYVNLGGPGAGGDISPDISPAAINYLTSGGVLHEHVFVTGNDGNLYADYWDGTQWAWSGPI